MSKGQKKKITIKIVPGEAVFVAPVEVLQHISATYLHIASQTESLEDSESWKNVSHEIDQWIEQTYYSGQGDYEEEW